MNLSSSSSPLPDAEPQSPPSPVALAFRSRSAADEASPRSLGVSAVADVDRPVVKAAGKDAPSSSSAFSRRGFSCSSRSTSALSSSVESCSRRIDCCSCGVSVRCCESLSWRVGFMVMHFRSQHQSRKRSEEHTSELQSHSDLVCRLLLEKKKKNKNKNRVYII